MIVFQFSKCLATLPATQGDCILGVVLGTEDSQLLLAELGLFLGHRLAGSQSGCWMGLNPIYVSSRTCFFCTSVSGAGGQKGCCDGDDFDIKPGCMLTNKVVV